MAERLLFAAFLLLLVWAPIPLGSNRPWAWMILEIWADAGDGIRPRPQRLRRDRVGIGRAGAGVAGAFVALALGAALFAQWRRCDPLMRGMSFACLMAVTAILIHSAVDFNLQIPANAALFMVVLALGWVSLFLDRHSPNRDRHSREGGNPVQSSESAVHQP